MLQKLTLFHTPVSVLAKSVQTVSLQTLNLSVCHKPCMHKLTDISALGECVSLHCRQVSDISALSKRTLLHKLDITGSFARARHRLPSY